MICLLSVFQLSDVILSSPFLVFPACVTDVLCFRATYRNPLFSHCLKLNLPANKELPIPDQCANIHLPAQAPPFLLSVTVACLSHLWLRKEIQVKTQSKFSGHISILGLTGNTTNLFSLIWHFTVQAPLMQNTWDYLPESWLLLCLCK